MTLLATEQDPKKIRELILQKTTLEAQQLRTEHDNKLKFFGIADPVKAEKHAKCCRLFHGPNPPQKELLAAWENPHYKVFTYTGANRIGKCVTYQTLIDTPSGEISMGELLRQGKAFDVYAWNGSEKVIARASAPFKKEGFHKCYRIEMSDGRFIEAADHHRILTTSGDYTTVDDLLACFSFPVRSNLECARKVHVSDDRHLNRTILNYQDRCFDDCRQYDARFPWGEDSDQFFSPSQGDVQERIYAEGRGYSDAQDNKQEHTHHHRGFFHRSIQDVLRHSWDRSSEFLCHIDDKISSFFSSEFRLSPIFASAGVFAFPQDHEVVQRSQHAFGSYASPLVLGGNRIESITPISTCQEVYDFEVPVYHNYCAGGMIHHNTTIGVILAFSVMFGKWLWDNKPIVFRHGHPRKVRYIGQDWEKHVKAVIEPALHKWWPKMRRLTTKKNNSGADYLWTDEETGSLLEVMSNMQESELHEGWEGDLIVYDEPPKRDIRVANARGLIDRCGRELFCMTLLSEAWISREVINARNADGTPDTTIFNTHGAIEANLGYGITKEGIDQFAKTLKEEQKDARLRGKPSYMSNLIYADFDRKIHLKKAFRVPLDWPIDIAIDFHPSKPWAVLFLATDRRNFKWVVDEIWQNGSWKTIGEEIVRRCKDKNYRVGKVLIDPLAKGDEQSDLNEESVYDKLSMLFLKYGYLLYTANKDKDGGINMVQDLLMTENEMPALFFFDTLRRTIEEIEGYMTDPETLKPEKKDDDMMENLYRLALLDTQYSEMDRFDEDEAREREVKRNKVTGY